MVLNIIFIHRLSLFIMNYSFEKIANKIYQLVKTSYQSNNILIIEENKNQNNLFNKDNKDNNSIKNRKVDSESNSEKLFIGFISKSQTVILNNNIFTNNKSVKQEIGDFRHQTTFNFKKCIDASPTISISKKLDNLEYTCFIGSHSSLFMSINIMEKTINWKSTLNDRIEGSACLSLCGKYVVVGCYDHYLYTLSVDGGQIVWKFKTDDIVKCTPVVDPNSGHVWFGGYDKILYEIDLDNKQLIGMFKTNGSILASPVIDSNRRYYNILFYFILFYYFQY